MSRPLVEVFGAAVRVKRAQRSWTQNELAKRSKLGRKTISLIETGNQSPAFSTIEVLAEVFEVPAQELLRDPDSEPGDAEEEELVLLVRALPKALRPVIRGMLTAAVAMRSLVPELKSASGPSSGPTPIDSARRPVEVVSAATTTTALPGQPKTPR